MLTGHSVYQRLEPHRQKAAGSIPKPKASTQSQDLHWRPTGSFKLATRTSVNWELVPTATGMDSSTSCHPEHW